MKVTARRALIAATVAVIAAGISVAAAMSTHALPGPFRIQQADVLETPSDSPSSADTPSDSPSPTDSPSPSPSDSSSPSPTQAPVGAPAPASASPVPPPPPTFCGHVETVDHSTVDFGVDSPMYGCSPSGIQKAPAQGSGPLDGHCVLNGIHEVIGYISDGGMRFYLLASFYPGCAWPDWPQQQLATA